VPTPADHPRPTRVRVHGRRLPVCHGLGALVLALTAAGAAPVPAADAPALRACTRTIAHATMAIAAMRERAVSVCVGESLACTTHPACARADQARCPRRLAHATAMERRPVRATDRCAARLSPESFLADDGLGYELLAPFCPGSPMRGQPADAVACQRQALACTSDRIMATLAPRTEELLARLDVVLAGAAGCLMPYTCGNGLPDPDEECDFGAANSDTRPNRCRTTCLAPSCGDGVVDEDEDCDDGNLADGDGCDADCFDEDDCGNGVVEADEECDDGNLADGDGCDADCFVEETGTCGDGIEDDDEECDEGAGNSDVARDRCRTDCRTPWCGDGVIDPGEDERCEPPGSLLCTEDCDLRIGLPASRLPRAERDRCAGRILREGLRVVRKARALAARCVQASARCVLGRDGGARCVSSATRACNAAAARRARLADAAAERAAHACGGEASGAAPMPLATFLDAHDGLGLRAVAARCPFDGARTPSAVDLFACAFGRARCLAERAVAETIPRASEFLWDVLDDPEAAFPCVADPTDLEPDVDFGSPSGAFVD
jgi:cysteine-rich repeat protein